jgi:histidyl-tRNA synthetase
MLIQAQEHGLPETIRPIVVVPLGDGMEIEALKLASELRRLGHVVDYGFKGRVGQRLKRAAQQNARFAVMLGEDELASGRVVLRDLDAGEQQDVDRAALGQQLSS